MICYTVRELLNLHVKLCNSALSDHLARKRSEGPKGDRQFWQMVGPFLNSKSSSKKSAHIDLIKNNEVISDQSKVSNIFNAHFINKPANIGNDLVVPWWSLGKQ